MRLLGRIPATFVSLLRTPFKKVLFYNFANMRTREKFEQSFQFNLVFKHPSPMLALLCNRNHRSYAGV